MEESKSYDYVMSIVNECASDIFETIIQIEDYDECWQELLKRLLVFALEMR